eukprot:gene22890-biopygen2785
MAPVWTTLSQYTATAAVPAAGPDAPSRGAGAERGSLVGAAAHW